MRDLYIDVSHEVLEDLKVRLRGARFPVVLDEQENNAGISVEFMKNLVDYWLTEYDWSADGVALSAEYPETALDRCPVFKPVFSR